MDDVSRLVIAYGKQNNDDEEKVDNLLDHLKAYYYVFHDISPYTEVRASVRHTDDPSMPVDTFRTWFLGIGFVVLFAGINQVSPVCLDFADIKFFSLRWPPMSVEAVCIQILAYPCGKALERWLPTRTFQLLGRNFSLNPAPFNQKEHMLITIMANVGLSSPYASWIFEVQILKIFFDQPWARNKLYQYCITISMQCLGFGIAGLARSCIVFPDYCVFPKTLPTIILNRSLHERSDDCEFRIRGIKFPQFRYLWVLGTAYFVWHLFQPAPVSHSNF